MTSMARKNTTPKPLDMDYTMIRRCMAVILTPTDEVDLDDGDFSGINGRTRTNSVGSLGPEIGKDIAEGPGPPKSLKYPGPQVFQSFMKENSECYWNPCLVQSVRNLEYRGCVSPGTLLVSGTEYSLEVVRSAWARRMLRAPSGYAISMLGDVDPVKMNVVAQTQFAPLPEALCKVVYDLNTEGNVATMSAIGVRLKATFPQILLPEETVLYTALGSLIRERKLFHTGKGYSVVTPDTFRLLAMSPPLERQMLLTNEEAILRLHGTAVTEGRTACTQTNQKDPTTLTAWSSAERILSPSSKYHQGKLKRCHSLKLLQRGRDKEKLSRSNSFRSSKASPARDAKSDAENLDPAIKKEKSSMFSKWFRRGREKKSLPKSSTVSSQFPPRDKSDPDFVLYNSRATQTLGKEERLPPKPPKTRSRSLNRHAERNSLYISTPVTPKNSRRSKNFTQTWDSYNSRSSSLPRKSISSVQTENSRCPALPSNKKSPRPAPRQRHFAGILNQVVPTSNSYDVRPPFESSFSPIAKSDEMLVKADDKYADYDSNASRPISGLTSYKPPESPRKPAFTLPSRNLVQPWRMLSNSTSTYKPKVGISEPMKPLSIGLPQRMIPREIASVTPSKTTVNTRPRETKTISESIVLTDSTSKKGVQIDGTVDVEINLEKLIGEQKKSALNPLMTIPSRNQTLKIAATFNQSVTNNLKPENSGNIRGQNPILSTTTSVKTSVSHGNVTTDNSKTVEVKCPVKSPGILKNTTVVDYTGKCTIVATSPKTSSPSFTSTRSKLADAKRDFFAESPSPTEPVSLKDDSGFSSSTSTSRPMSVSPC